MTASNIGVGPSLPYTCVAQTCILCGCPDFRPHILGTPRKSPYPAAGSPCVEIVAGPSFFPPPQQPAAAGNEQGTTAPCYIGLGLCRPKMTKKKSGSMNHSSRADLCTTRRQPPHVRYQVADHNSRFTDTCTTCTSGSRGLAAGLVLLRTFSKDQDIQKLISYRNTNDLEYCTVCICNREKIHP